MTAVPTIPPDRSPPTLTPADIAFLRLNSQRRGGFISDGDGPRATPYVTCSPSDATFYLHSGGATVAVSADPRVIAACLLAERIEPGYCRRILDPRENVDYAALSPQQRQEAERKRAAARAHARALDDAAQTAERERQRLIDNATARGAARIATADLDLSDLL